MATDQEPTAGMAPETAAAGIPGMPSGQPAPDQSEPDRGPGSDPGDADADVSSGELVDHPGDADEVG